MRYCDLHCDTLTTTTKRQITAESLRNGECLLQCFAVFLRNTENAFAQTCSYCRRFYFECKKYGCPVRNADFGGDGVHALLTVEGGEAIEGDLQNLEQLYALGVRMMTLTWNRANKIGFPNFPVANGKHMKDAGFRERKRGLTPFGAEVVERMRELRMLVDVSHGSDKLFWDVKDILRGVPFVASHSNADEAYPHARNLQPDQIRAVAESGGVVGLNFCVGFLSDDRSAEGQRNALLSHAKAIYCAGGEDVLAIGSDFDGIEPNAYLRTPSDMPKLFDAFEKQFGARIAEKIAYRNVLRVLRQL